MTDIFNQKEEKEHKISSNIKVIKIIAIILALLIVVGLIALIVGLINNYNNLDKNEEINKPAINQQVFKYSTFNVYHPNEAQLISASLGIDNEILLRYQYKGKNVLVILDKITNTKKSIITLEKKYNAWEFKNN